MLCSMRKIIQSLLFLTVLSIGCKSTSKVSATLPCKTATPKPSDFVGKWTCIVGSGTTPLGSLGKDSCDSTVMYTPKGPKVVENSFWVVPYTKNTKGQFRVLYHNEADRFDYPADRFNFIDGLLQTQGAIQYPKTKDQIGEPNAVLQYDSCSDTLTYIQVLDDIRYTYKRVKEK